MARDRFNSISGGLIDSVVAGIGNSVTQTIQNTGSGANASFSINSVLGTAIESTTGYALNAGQNYLLSQLGSSLTNSEQGAMANAVITQVASAGIDQALSFASSIISNPFTGPSSVTTAGLGAQAARGSKSISDSVASKLEAADYGGISYTLEDIVFTLVPSNAGAQTSPMGQSSPTIPWNVGFDENAAKSLPPVDALKGTTALNGPAKGVNIGGRNFGAAYTTLGGRASQVKPISPVRLEPFW